MIGRGKRVYIAGIHTAMGHNHVLLTTMLARITDR
jgi:hypothetical protein